MSWLRIEDGFGEHEKVVDLSDRSFRLHVVALCYCARNLTDGILTAKRVAAVLGITASRRANILELVAAGLWSEHGKGGYRIKDYLEYNPSKVEVLQKRADAKERMRRLRNGEGSREQTREHADEQDENVRAVFANPVPCPSPKDLSEGLDLDLPNRQAEILETINSGLA